MNCEHFQTLLAAELYGDNSPEESQALKAHLASCPACSLIESGMRKAVDAVPPPHVPQDEAYWIHQKASIMERLPKRSAVSWLAWQRLAGPVVALSVMVSVWGWHHEQEQTTLRITQNMDLLQNMDMLQQLDTMNVLDAIEGQK